MKSRVVTHRGRKIIVSDFSDMNDFEVLREEVDDIDAVIVQEEPGTVLNLVDVRSTKATKEAIELFKVSAKRTDAYVSRTAVLGVTGVRKIMLSAINLLIDTKMHAFDDERAAMDWLVEAS